MFWEVFSNLCVLNNTKPTSVAVAIGLSNAIPTKWKNGALPKGEILLKLAEYFDCSIDYLLTGKEKSPSSMLNEEEQRCIKAFNNLLHDDKIEFIARMEQRAEDYTPEQKEKHLS